MTAEELWRLFDRKEEIYRGQKHFFEKWVHDRSHSGIIFYSTLDEQDRICYVVEGYGIGTINTKTFTERETIAPIQRSRHYDLEEARKRLEALKEENAECWKRHRGVE